MGETTGETRYRAVTAQAWTGMLVVPIAACAADLWRIAIQGSNLQVRPNDPVIGIWIFAVATCANALLLVGIRALDSSAFRRFVFGAGVLYLIALLLSQGIDLILGVRRSGLHILMAVTHDTLAVLACWASGRWLSASISNR